MVRIETPQDAETLGWVGGQEQTIRESRPGPSDADSQPGDGGGGAGPWSGLFPESREGP